MTETRTAPAKAKGPLPLYLDDVVILRKPHPCGGNTWRIVRLGADIGLRCTTCEHRVLVARSPIERDIKQRRDVYGLGFRVSRASGLRVPSYGGALNVKYATPR